MQEEIKEKVVMEAKDGGLMNLGGKEMDMRKVDLYLLVKKKEQTTFLLDFLKMNL